MALEILTDDQLAALRQVGSGAADRRARALVELVLAGWSAGRIADASVLVLTRECPAAARFAVDELLESVATTALYPLSPRPAAPLSRVSLNRILARHGRRHGIAGVSPRSLRLTALVHRLRAGATAEEVARDLGVSPASIYERLRRNGIALRRGRISE